MHARQHFVATVDDLFRVGLNIAEYVAEHPPERLYTRMALIDLTIGRNARQVEHHAGVHVCEGGVPIASVIGGLSTRKVRKGLLRTSPAEYLAAQDEDVKAKASGCGRLRARPQLQVRLGAVGHVVDDLVAGDLRRSSTQSGYRP